MSGKVRWILTRHLYSGTLVDTTSDVPPWMRASDRLSCLCLHLTPPLCLLAVICLIYLPFLACRFGLRVSRLLGGVPREQKSATLVHRVPVGPHGKGGSWNATLNVRHQVIDAACCPPRDCPSLLTLRYICIPLLLGVSSAGVAHRKKLRHESFFQCVG